MFAFKLLGGMHGADNLCLQWMIVQYPTAEHETGEVRGSKNCRGECVTLKVRRNSLAKESASPNVAQRMPGLDLARPSMTFKFLLLLFIFLYFFQTIPCKNLGAASLLMRTTV